MNAVIGLCHFCELHGPSVLFVTQTFHEPDGPLAPQLNVQAKPKKFYGSALEWSDHSVSNCAGSSCEACQSLNPCHSGLLSNDHEGHISYLSTQQPTQNDVAALVRQACIRSLSCEVSPGKEGPVFFGDEIRGHVLSYTFFLKDAHARGFHRWYSIIVLMRDKIFLLNSWPFLVEHIQTIITELQTKASKVYEKEQAECPQRAMRLAAASEDGEAKKCQNSNKPARSITELTADPQMYTWLHLRFTWLLKAGANRLTEKMIEGLPTPDLSLEGQSHQETEEGFTLVMAKLVHSPVHELEASASHEEEHCAPAVHSLRHLYQILGQMSFMSLAYSLIVGRQIVIRGNPPGLISSIASCLKILVPRWCYRARLDADQYLDASHCNLLGIAPHIAVPQPNPAILRLDILQPDNQSDLHNVNKYTYKITWGGKLPQKCPTVLMKMEKAIENTKLNDSVLHYHFVALKEEWLNIAKVVRRVQQWNAGQAQDVTNLMQAMGAQEHDKAVLDFWGAGCV